MNRLLILLPTGNKSANHLVDAFPEASYEVIQTSGLDEFTRSIENRRFDLAIVQGEQALDAITIARKHSIPAIFLASENSDNEIISVFRAGASDCLRSPQSTGEIAESVERFFSG